MAAAQTNEAPEEVIVTGSRIARGSDFESPAPVLTVDEGSIERAGYNNLQQLMEKLPVAGVGTFSTRATTRTRPQTVRRPSACAVWVRMRRWCS